MEHKVTCKGCDGWCWHHDISWQVQSQLDKPDNKRLINHTIPKVSNGEEKPQKQYLISFPP